MSQVKIENVTKNDREGWLKAVWSALDNWDDYVADDHEANNYRQAENHDEICTAMAWIREELGLPSETEAAEDGDEVYQETERGAASLFIELHEGQIIIRHGTEERVALARKQRAVTGDWDKLCKFLRDDLDIEWLVS